MRNSCLGLVVPQRVVGQCWSAMSSFQNRTALKEVARPDFSLHEEVDQLGPEQSVEWMTRAALIAMARDKARIKRKVKVNMQITQDAHRCPRIHRVVDAMCSSWLPIQDVLKVGPLTQQCYAEPTCAIFPE